MTQSAPNSGNVLFLILIAVVLFAALSYAVTSSTRSGGGNADNEKNQLKASGIQNYATGIRSAVHRLMIAGGCNDTNINFANPIVTTNFNYVNSSAPADNRCDVFHPAGGGIVWPVDSLVNNLPKSMIISARNQIKDIGTVCTVAPYTACLDVILVMIDLTKETCMEINKNLGISQAGLETPEIADITAGSGFTGTYTSNAAIIGNTANDSALAGQMSGCFKETLTQSYQPYSSTSQTPYIFYQVLIPR